MLVGVVEEHFEGGTVENIGAGVQFKADHSAVVGRQIQQGSPEPGEFLEGFVDEAIGTLRPGIHHMPGKAAG